MKHFRGSPRAELFIMFYQMANTERLLLYEYLSQANHRGLQTSSCFLMGQTMHGLSLVTRLRKGYSGQRQPIMTRQGQNTIPGTGLRKPSLYNSVEKC